MSNKSETIYIANTSGAAEVDGVEFDFVQGETRLREGHPLLKACPKYFEPLSDDVTWVGGRRIRTL